MVLAIRVSLWSEGLRGRSSASNDARVDVGAVPAASRLNDGSLIGVLLT